MTAAAIGTKCRGRNCMYADRPEGVNTQTPGCKYAAVTGQTKLPQIYQKLGITIPTAKQLEEMDKHYCPFYARGPRKRTQPSFPKHGAAVSTAQKKRWKYNWAAAKTLYEQGANDREIADALKIPQRQICAWRNRQGMPKNNRQTI